MIVSSTPFGSVAVIVLWRWGWARATVVNEDATRASAKGLRGIFFLLEPPIPTVCGRRRPAALLLLFFAVQTEMLYQWREVRPPLRLTDVGGEPGSVSTPLVHHIGEASEQLFVGERRQ